MTRRFPVRAVMMAAALLAPVGAVTLQASPAAAQAARDPQAEAFIQSEASRALQILKTGDRAAEKSEFHGFVDQVADVPRITRFVLGKYARTISPAQYQQFATVFRAYADSVYESRLGQYHGESLRVTGSTVRRPGDVVVASEVVGGQMRQPAPVAWRVIRGTDGRWRVVDVEVSGVWLAITQQQDFVSTLDNHGGDINVLINQLRANTSEAARG